MNFLAIEQWMEHLIHAQRENDLPEFDKAAVALKDNIKINRCKTLIDVTKTRKDNFIEERDKNDKERFRTALDGNTYDDVLNHFEKIVMQHNTAISEYLVDYMQNMSKGINNEGYLKILQSLKKDVKPELMADGR